MKAEKKAFTADINDTILDSTIHPPKSKVRFTTKNSSDIACFQYVECSLAEQPFPGKPEQ